MANRFLSKQSTFQKRSLSKLGQLRGDSMMDLPLFRDLDARVPSEGLLFTVDATVCSLLYLTDAWASLSSWLKFLRCSLNKSLNSFYAFSAFASNATTRSQAEQKIQSGRLCMSV